jgi:fatty acid desaturase
MGSSRPVTQDDYRISPAIALGCTCLASAAYVVLCLLGLRMNSALSLLLLSLPLGFVLQFFFNALHYCTHDTFVKSKYGNYALGIAFGCITIFNFALYKPYHLQHHRYLFTDRDPEPINRSIKSKSRYFLEMFIPLFFFDNWRQSARLIVRSRGPKTFDREVPRLTRTDRIMGILNNGVLLVWLSFTAALTLVHGPVMIWLYWLPLYVSFVLANFVILSEHYATDRVVGMNTVNSRTIQTGPVTRFFIVGLNYHAEHHLYPGVPFHNLPKINKRIEGQIKHAHDSYLAFHWSLLRSLPWRSAGTDGDGCQQASANR